MRILGDQDCARLGRLLHARRHVDGITHGRVFHAQVRADRTHYDQPGVDAHAHIEVQAHRAP